MHKTVMSICQVIDNCLYILLSFSVTFASVDTSDEEK